MDTDHAVASTARSWTTTRAETDPYGTADGPARIAMALLAGLALIALSSPADAQVSQGLGLEVTAGYQTLSGDDFDAFDDAAAFEAIGSYAWTDGWEVGVGAGIASHDVAGAENATDRIDVFGEGRYRFNVPAQTRSHLHPFLSGRLGYTTLTTDDGDVSQSGLLVGGGAGVEYWLSDEVGLLGAATLDYLTYGDSDDVTPLPERSGLGLRVRGGLKVRFPSR